MSEQRLKWTKSAAPGFFFRALVKSVEVVWNQAELPDNGAIDIGHQVGDNGHDARERR
jgi:hypothetical protein